MPDGHIAFEGGELAGRDDLSHKALALYSFECSFACSGDDSATFLSAVLKGMKTIIHKSGRVRNPVDAENSALFVDFSV